MAKPSLDLITSLRRAASHLSESNVYQWGHMGSCNCGFLAQELTGLKKEEIHRRAMERHGDWREQLNDYCPTSGLAIDDLITFMLERGFDRDDLKNLERLSDPEVLLYMGDAGRDLRHNLKPHVVAYLRAWASMLEERLLQQVRIPALTVRKEAEKEYSL